MIINNIFYINLPTRKDKKQFILEQLSTKPKNIPINKIDGEIVLKNELSGHRFVKHLINEKTPDIELCGIVGVNLAHKKALESIKVLSREKNNFSLIIEDDIFIDKLFWQHIFDLQPANADIIFFDSMRYQQVRFKNKNLIPTNYTEITKSKAKDGLYAGAFCYAVNNSSINKIINIFSKKSNKFMRHYDQLLYLTPRINKSISICNLIDVNFSFGSDRIGCSTEEELVGRGFIA